RDSGTTATLVGGTSVDRAFFFIFSSLPTIPNSGRAHAQNSINRRLIFSTRHLPQSLHVNLNGSSGSSGTYPKCISILRSPRVSNVLSVTPHPGSSASFLSLSGTVGRGGCCETASKLSPARHV